MKLKDVNSISKINRNKRIVFVSGFFNVIHPGHLRLLKFSKEFGDILVVGVIANEEPDDYVSFDDRVENVKAIQYVDIVIKITDLKNDLAAIKPHFIVKGKEYEGKLNIEQAIAKEIGAKLIFSSGNANISPYHLGINKYNSSEKLIKPSDYIKRHNITKSSLINIIDRFKDVRVAVIGDTIIDEYIGCEILGLSQEEPNIVLSPVDSKTFIGGAAIVAMHCAGMGAKTKYYSVTGNDKLSDYVNNQLNSKNIESTLFKDESRPTTLKQRYRVRDRSIFRVSHLRQHEVSLEITKKIIASVTKSISEIDVLIFSDFNYGCIGATAIKKLSDVCVKNNVILIADSQASSQISDITKYKNMSLITPTEREARLPMNDYTSGLVHIASKLYEQSNCKDLIIKLGEDGLLIFKKDGNNILADSLPALNNQPKDVSGAGDTLLATMALTLKNNGSIWEASYLGSVAAAIQVMSIGNKQITANDLIKHLE